MYDLGGGLFAQVANEVSVSRCLVHVICKRRKTANRSHSLEVSFDSIALQGVGTQSQTDRFL